MKLCVVASIGPVNSIGFIRLLCATLVVIGHSFPIGGFGLDPLIVLSKNQIAIGRVPVNVFFCLSGYLIAKSFESRTSLISFVWARFLRVYPAYWICIAITAFLIPLIFNSNISLLYFIKNIPLIIGGQGFVPGLNHGSGGHKLINGALWTLSWELKAYVLCALFGLLGGFKSRWATIVVFLVMWLMFVVNLFKYQGIETSPAIVGGWRLFTFFSAGMLFYDFGKYIPLTRAIFIGSLLLLISACVVGVFFPISSGGMFYAVAPLPLTYVVFYCAKFLPFESINSKNDISYGVYIYGTLILNILAMAGFNYSWFVYVAATYLITFAMAKLSWHLIESPSLRAKNMFS